MRDTRPRIGIAAALLTSLALFGCSKPEPPPPPPPPAASQIDEAALKRKIAELKAKNPNLPPSAIGTMASQMVQQEKARGGAPR